ncbi:hypothetical protein Taro_016157 [Colocasia esculenta]|uniref:Uncharacterized protein n=1 Tax=Colocasia esculenta TaxID=4460 RepID=A0A843UN43_COLES|nr:hypothetical protein [Colocasia esculenta]
MSVDLHYLVQAGFPLSVFSSRVVVTTSSRTEFPTVLYPPYRCETSQQRQGTCRVDETGR